MVMYGPTITEAKRIKGQEYDKLSKKSNNPGNITGSTDNDHMGSTSIGRGGVLDSVAQKHIEDIDLEKEKIILESEEIIGQYMDYTGDNLKRAIMQRYDSSKSQLEKRMVDDFNALKDSGIDNVFGLIADEYYGWKHIGGMDKLFDDNITEDDFKKIEDTLRRILRMRINYVNKITSLMAKMLRTNYKILGLSEEQANVYINNLISGTNDSVKSAGEIKDLIKANADKFITNNGDSIDLRPIGFGVILGPSEGYELNLAGTDGTNKDAMLSLIQQAMRYDAVVIAHGGDKEKIQQSKHISDDDWSNALGSIREVVIRDKKSIIEKISKSEDITDMSWINLDVVLTEKIALYIDENVRKLIPTLKDYSDIVDKIDDFLNTIVIKISKSVFKKKFEEAKDKASEKEVLLLNKYMSEASKILYNNVFLRVIRIVIKMDFEYEKYWSCDPTKTLTAGPFKDVNELIRQLIKEGYKKIIINDCNPGGHQLDKDIMDTKGILINHSDFSNYVESFVIDSNDADLRIISEAEISLMEFAESYGIDYNDNEYLEECCQWYLENYEMIHEGEIFDKLKEFFKRIVAGIIGFIKSILRLVKKAFHKLKDLFTGTKDEPKDTETKFQKPIKTKLIDIESKKVIETISNNREELNKEASKMCSKLAEEIKKFNQKQQNSLKKIKSDVEELSRKENSVKKESFEFNFIDSFLIEGVDLLSNLELLREFEDANGPVADDEEEPADFSMDDDAGTTEAEPAAEPASEEPAAEEDEPEDFSMDDEGEAEPEAEPEEGEEPDDAPEDEDYEIPDEEGEENPEGEEPADDEAPEDEEFSMDDAGDGTEGEEPTDDTTDDSMGDDTPSDDNIDPKLKELEAVVFDNLSEKEKELKIKDLKELYITVYKKCGTISELLTDIKRDEETIQIVEYISNTLIDLKQYVNDYINDIFDSKTYVENLAQLQKYIMIFNAINKVFSQIRDENKE